jgi:hypothetical protein
MLSDRCYATCSNSANGADKLAVNFSMVVAEWAQKCFARVTLSVRRPCRQILARLIPLVLLMLLVPWRVIATDVPTGFVQKLVVAHKGQQRTPS